MMTKRFVVCGLCLCIMLCTLEAKKEKSPVYKNANAPTEKRVEDLLLLMTMEEKVQSVRCGTEYECEQHW